MAAIRTRERVNPVNPREVLVENVEFLIETGEHPTRILSRLGMNMSALEQDLRRAGRRDLFVYFSNESHRVRKDRRLRKGQLPDD